ncbi:hypothetical protein GCM10007916_27930 [Psychromonas marina]|uniref:Uncharacterized protein n=1 Tax=Psychromonas marina TaxID=88364 RepID=A0ABQ6E3F3_9GAMM|nr:hypothetical protein [Psychromonas marina]GLS91723.1 hypothetical protein GCM10007916_27930 [Psychromonas marina]
MLSIIQALFTRTEDHAGRDIDKVIKRLASKMGTTPYAWSYIKEQSVYENTTNGMRVYPHELEKYAA